jgi:hypothetical protein
VNCACVECCMSCNNRPVPCFCFFFHLAVMHTPATRHIEHHHPVACHKSRSGT